ncbi:MAG: Hsp20/alpha crystallin family protein [Phycisphaerae bacterium]
MLPVLFKTRLGSPLAARWGFDPFCELDRFADALFSGRPSAGLHVDVREDQDNFYIDADVPGFAREDIEVTSEDGILTISGQRKSEESREGENFHVTERRMGRFSRTFRLPDGVKEDSVAAELKDGVLTVTLAKTEEVKPRRIEVKPS